MAFDQYEIESTFSGSYIDNTIIDSSIFTEGKLSRTFIGSKSTRQTTAAFKSIVLPYSDRLNYVSGAGIGAASKNQFLTLSAINEAFLDSYLPSPVDILIKNGTEFPNLLEDDYGFLSGSSLFNRPELSGSIDIFISDGDNNYAGFGFDADAFLDTTWLSSPCPFNSSYKNITKILKPSLQYKEKIQLTKKIDGSPASETINTNQIGSVYYISNQNLELVYASAQITAYANDTLHFQYIPIVQLSRNMLCATYAPFQENVHIIGSEGEVAYSLNGIGWNSIARNKYHGTDTLITGSTGDWSGFNAYMLYNDITYAIQTDSIGQKYLRWIFVGHTFGEGATILIDPPTSITTADNRLSSSIPSTSGRVDWRKINNTSLESQTGIVDAADELQIYNVAYSDEYGADESNARFVAVGGNSSPRTGEIIVSTDNTGTSWTVPSSVPAIADYLNAVRHIDNGAGTSRFIAVGNNGVIVISDTTHGDGSWTITNGPGVSADQLNDIAVINGTGIAIAVGFQGNILRSTDAGSTWSTITTSFTFDTFFGVKEVVSNNTNVDFIAVGDSSIIQSTDLGLTWEESTTTKAILTGFIPDYKDVLASGIDYEGSVGDYIDSSGIIAAADSRFLYQFTQDPLPIRATDLETREYIDNVNDAAFLEKGSTFSGPVSSPTGKPPTLIRQKFQDINKCFYGFGDGIKVNLSNVAYLSNTFSTSELGGTVTLFRKKIVNFSDISFNDQINISGFERIRGYGPKLRGWRYGIYNGSPHKSNVIFRRGKYGQFRDILEPRLQSAFLLQDGDKVTTTYPVDITFISGTFAAASASIYTNTTTVTTFNPEDSGTYDIHYRSGKPFNDLDNRK